MKSSRSLPECQGHFPHESHRRAESRKARWRRKFLWPLRGTHVIETPGLVQY